MKNLFPIFILCLGFCLCLENAFAKKVKFAVNMNEQTISPNGVWVNGDFQTLLGLPNNDTIAIRLLQEGTSGIYSTVLDLPAFRKYEYKFLNGDQFYETEIVPEPSRVGHDFNDNRWIYVDSIATDTFFVGAIRFGENAPAGLTMIRFLVQMNNVNPSQPVHLATSFTNWNFARNTMYRFVDQLYEIILFASNGNYEYSFSNGGSVAGQETLAGVCASPNGKRMLTLLADTILEPVCFGECTPCLTNVLSSATSRFFAELYPNPTENGKIFIQPNGQVTSLEVFNSEGKKLKNFPPVLSGPQHIALPGTGLYFIHLSSLLENGKRKSFKILVP